MLGALQTWMGNNNRAITVVICLVFGAFSSGEDFWVRKSMGERGSTASGTNQRPRAPEAGESR